MISARMLLVVLVGVAVVAHGETVAGSTGTATKVGLGPAKETEASSWLTSLDEAKKAAATRGVPILVDFSGSDWCGWCMKLDKEVFSQQAFKDFAKTNVVLLLVDFPRHKALAANLKEQNRKLADTYGIRGFPSVLLLDATGKLLAQTGYQPGGAGKYVEHLKALLATK